MVIYHNIEVLGDGFVKYITHSGDDLLVANAARVSFNKKKSVFDWRDAKLLKYLASHNHWTPFAHPQITLHIKAPIFVRTQLFKHKVGFVENEMSRRYVDDPPTFCNLTWRARPVGSMKQGSGGEIVGEAASTIPVVAEKMYKLSSEIYDKLINEFHVAPEQARAVLPQGMFTEWYWTGSLAAYARVYKLRASEDSQAETCEYAEALNKVIAHLYPVAWSVLTTHSLPESWDVIVNKHAKDPNHDASKV